MGILVLLAALICPYACPQGDSDVSSPLAASSPCPSPSPPPPLITWHFGKEFKQCVIIPHLLFINRRDRKRVNIY